MTVGMKFIEKGSADENPPPGDGFTTKTLANPEAATCVEETWASSWVVERYVVGSAVPFHSTVEAGTKLFPVTVNRKPELPASTAEGFSEPREGDGLEPLIVN
jgi:hypothetical protein